MIAPDKKKHILGGCLVLLFTLAALALGMSLGMHIMALGVFVAGWVAGIAVEGTQWSDNRTIGAKHEISFWDAFATAAPCTLAALVIEWALRVGWIAS